MKIFIPTNYFYLLIIFIISSKLAGAQTILPPELTADYGPPTQANTWEKFTIPLTPESFNTDSETFASVMENITSFWIETEMHVGDDVGGIDEVLIGETYWSYFESSAELWSSGGDGTMEWMPSDGVNGGYLQISDWVTGDYHWLIAPSTWAGDWSGLIGQNIEFWFKTDRPSFSAVVKLTSELIYRLVINTPTSNTIPVNDSILSQLEIIPPLTEELTISLTSSDNTCVMVPATVVVPAGDSTAKVYFVAAKDATVGCESVIEATANNYLSSRVTIVVKGYSGLNDPVVSNDLVIAPNPFTTSTTIEYQLIQPETVRIIFYNQFGKQVDLIEERQQKGLNKVVWSPENLADGIYFFRLQAGEWVASGKVVLVR